jgi:hypothetical protein
MSPLERRYRRLLRAYPKQYRSARADEMIGTLLDATAPGQRRPSARESVSLIAGGVRARAARNADMPALASLRLAAMLACSVYIADTAAEMFTRRPDEHQAGATYVLAISVALLVATILVWLVRRAFAVAALAAVLATGYFWHVRGIWPYLAVALAVLTALRAERPPKSWLWWICLPAAFWLIDPSAGTGIEAFHFALIVTFMLAPLPWALVDARPAFALAILTAFFGIALGVRAFAAVAAVICLAICLAMAAPLLAGMARRRRRAKA